MARPLALLWAAVALALCSSAHSQSYSLQGAAVRIIFPPGYRTTTIDMAMADFGRAEYGASLVGKLFYPNEDAAYNPYGKPYRCPSARCEYACDDFSTANPPFAITKKPGEFAIMLVDRGPQNSAKPCYFLTKAWNAQLAGADAVLVVDDTDSDLTTAVAPDKEEVAHLLNNLTVSMALITKKDGNLLKSLVKDQASVVIALNWTNLEPRRSKVAWEFWTTTNDQCGTLCKEQGTFITGMKAMSRALSQKNLTEFSPHYVLWSCPAEYAQSVECQNECVMNGKYCAPDPDGKQTEGYSGVQVLQLNVRHMCYYRLAREAGSPWLWWDFADLFKQKCKSSTNNFTIECAQQVFLEVNGPLLLKGQGQSYFDECIARGTPPADRSSTQASLPLLDEELKLQMGDPTTAAVSILPTIRINGKQFRGTLDVRGVMKALCAAFTLNEEPAICNDKSVSEDECEAWGVGHKNCKVGDPAAAGRTRCINTFSGYQCECGQGWVRSAKADTGEEVCEDINECLATNVMLTDPQCGCDRCACVNLVGGYKCTGPLANKCTAEYDYGGCWRSQWDGQTAHACVDAIETYKRQAARGTLDSKADWFTCQCPSCFTPANLGTTPKELTCSAQCSASQCVSGVCVFTPQPSGGGGGGGGSPTPTPGPSGGGSSGGGGGGMSGFSVFLTVMLTVGLTTGALYAVYHYVLRQRMEGEIRDIMSQYMPLDPRGGAGGGRGGRGGRGSALSPVHEAEDEMEDAPLMGSAAAAGGRGAGFRAPAEPPQAPQRAAYGGLVAPSPQDKPVTGGYQPPLPVPEDEPETAGLAFGPAGGSGGAATSAAEPAKEAAPAKPAAPLGNAPLLGEGPL